MSVVCCRSKFFTSIKYPIILTQHILYSGTENLIFLVHYVAAGSETYAPVVVDAFVANESSRYILFKMIDFRTVHAVINHLFLPCCSAIGYGIDGKTKVGFLNTSAIVVKGILCLKVHPVVECHRQSVEAECSPSFIGVLKSMADIIRI